MARPTLPDVARVVSQALRAMPEIADLVDDRVYTAFPAQLDPALPFALVQRIGGEPALARPLVVDVAAIQLDAYGGTQAQAHELVATCRAELAELQGEQAGDAGNVCGVIAGALRYVPDEAFTPARPRYVADLEVTVKPSANVIAGARPAAVTAGIRPANVIAGTASRGGHL